MTLAYPIDEQCGASGAAVAGLQQHGEAFAVRSR